MRLLKWFASVSALASIGVAVGWLWANAEIISDVAPGSPEATPTSTVASDQDQLPSPPGVPPAADLLQTQSTSPPGQPELPPVAVQIAVPAPARNPLPMRAPPAPVEDTQSQTTTLDLRVVPVPTGAPDQKAPAPPTSSTEQERTAQAVTPGIMLGVPSYGLQTLVDERRDELRRQRDARLDANRGPRLHMPPWFTAYDDNVEHYRDARRAQFRRQRDRGLQRHASWMDAICPWSKPRRDWTAQRSYRRQMKQLDQRVYRNTFIYRPPYGFAGPMRW